MAAGLDEVLGEGGHARLVEAVFHAMAAQRDAGQVWGRRRVVAKLPPELSVRPRPLTRGRSAPAARPLRTSSGPRAGGGEYSLHSLLLLLASGRCASFDLASRALPASPDRNRAF